MNRVTDTINRVTRQGPYRRPPRDKLINNWPLWSCAVTYRRQEYRQADPFGQEKDILGNVKMVWVTLEWTEQVYVRAERAKDAKRTIHSLAAFDGCWVQGIRVYRAGQNELRDVKYEKDDLPWN